MTFFSDTRKALEARLDSLSGKPPIAWENVTFTPTENTTFIAPFLLPSPSVLAALNGLQEDQGIFQVDVYIPLEKGTAALNTLADSISNHFKGQRLTSGSATVEIRACSYRFQGREDAWYKGIIEINYLCYSS